MANDIAPFTTTTNNVSLAINQAAVKFGVVPARVGFDIMKVTTTI